jgi:hypothetical protein
MAGGGWNPRPTAVAEGGFGIVGHVTEEDSALEAHALRKYLEAPRVGLVNRVVGSNDVFPLE